MYTMYMVKYVCDPGTLVFSIMQQISPGGYVNISVSFANQLRKNSLRMHMHASACVHFVYVRVCVCGVRTLASAGALPVALPVAVLPTHAEQMIIAD